MPRITMPEVKLPKVELPDSLREMTADDIAKAMPEVKLPKIDLPRKVDLRNVEVPKVQIELPRKLEMPRVEVRRKRSGPPWLLFALVAGFAAVAWMALSSPTVRPRIRAWLDERRTRFEHWGEQMASGRQDTTHEMRALPTAERADAGPDAYADELPGNRTA